jgi:hypothetical protein
MLHVCKLVQDIQRHGKSQRAPLRALSLSLCQIIHLEYGACSHIDRIELNRIAAECNVCHRFIDLDYIQELWYGDTCYGDPFKCPTCYATFSKLSSLFQHIESSACAQTLDENGIDELRNHLAIYLSEING